MEFRCGAETVVQFIQHDYVKAEYQQCPKCFRRHIHYGDVIDYNPFRQINKHAPVPEGADLRVNLDSEAMSRWSKQLHEYGSMNNSLVPDNPGQYRRLPLN